MQRVGVWVGLWRGMVVGIVAAAVGQIVAAFGQAHLNAPKGAVHLFVGGGVGQGVIMGAVVDGVRQCAGQVIGVRESLAARVAGQLVHGKCNIGALTGFLTQLANAVLVVTGSFGGVVHLHPLGVDRIDGHIRERQQTGGLFGARIETLTAERAFLLSAAGKDRNREGTGEPDQILAPLDAGQVAGQKFQPRQRHGNSFAGLIAGDAGLPSGEASAGAGVACAISPLTASHHHGVHIGLILIVGIVLAAARGVGLLQNVSVFRVVQRRAQRLAIRREAMNQPQPASHHKDGDLCSRLHPLEKVENLLMDVYLILQGRIQLVY